jgi:type VI secretion system secreted protein VgrG
VKTNSSKGGGGFSELVFEDKKDGEFVRLQSERDFKQIIKNNAEITVGLEHRMGGTFTQTIYGDKTETLLEGDHRFTVAKGLERVSIAQSRKTKVGDDDTLSVKGGKSDDISRNYNIDVGSTLEINAGSKVVITCGSSKIEMTPSKVTISSTQLEFKAAGTAKVTAGGQLTMEGKGQASLTGGGMLNLQGKGMAQLKSSGMLMVKGAITMIN